MYPGMMHWWRRGHRSDWAEHPGCGSAFGGRHGGWQASGGEDSDIGGASFGVRRPLRFLAYRLELSEEQVAELAKILDELKTERAQASVDNRRAVASFAEAVTGEAFGSERVTEAAKARTASSQRLNDAVAAALQRIHALLDPAQRTKLAYLIRTGTLAL